MRQFCEIEGCGRKATRKDMCQKHYLRVKVHGDPLKTNRRSNGDGKGYRNKGQRGTHVVVAELALGHPLPSGAVVHHVNEDKSDNRGENLVICPSMEYHALIHIRMRALKECGHADWRKCKICGCYGPVGDVTVAANGAVYHPACNRAHVAKYAQRSAALL